LADEVQLKFSADLGGALSSIAALKQAVTGVVAPVAQLKGAFAEASAAIQQSSSTAIARFKADMQSMVAERAISLRQALGFDADYTAQRADLEREDLRNILAGEALTLDRKSQTYEQLVALSQRYSAQLAADQARMAVVAAREADLMARPYRQAFDAIGAGWRSAVIGLVEGTMNFQTAALRVAQSVERGFITMAQTTLSRAAAGPLAALLGQAAPAAGEGVGDVLGNAVSRWIFGAPTKLGEAAATTANTAALAANTAALGAVTAALGASAAAGSAGAVGGAAALAGGTAAAGAAAGGGGLFGFLGSLFAFGRGGIVPSAARGWALPNFAGATPALLHAREMVLPAPISEGLQRLIGEGGGGGDMHLHFHGPSDGPAVERWFTGLMARNPGVVRNMLRSNALTPRTL